MVENRAFIKAFRSALYDRRLNWPEKCILLAVIDTPPDKEINWATIARKFKRHSSSVYKWKKRFTELALIK